MEFEQTAIEGCVLLRPRSIEDDRGRFMKTLHVDAFKSVGLRTDWREEFVSRSKQNVVRGMHFQTPPADHAKLVYCLSGAVLDVVVDLRKGSPTDRAIFSTVLDERGGLGLYIPSGCAHGFLALSEESLMLYKVTSVHAPDHDSGIAWDSLGFDWPVNDPIVSDRDRQHPKLAHFASPFEFNPREPRR